MFFFKGDSVSLFLVSCSASAAITAAASSISIFGGLDPLLVVPIGGIAVGWLVLLLLTALSAAWPAASVGRTAPLKLLQEGRSAF